MRNIKTLFNLQQQVILFVMIAALAFASIAQVLSAQVNAMPMPSLTYGQSYSLSDLSKSYPSTLHDITLDFSSDGMFSYEADLEPTALPSASILREYALTSPFNMIDTVTPTGDQLVLEDGLGQYIYRPNSTFMSHDGMHFTVSGTTAPGDNSSVIVTFDLATAYDLSSVTGDSGWHTLDPGQASDQKSFTYNNDGTKLYAVNTSPNILNDNVDNTIVVYNLPTAYDPTGATSANHAMTWYPIDISATQELGYLTFSSDGLSAFVSSLETATPSSTLTPITEYSLAVAYDLGTVTVVTGQTGENPGGSTGTAPDIRFSNPDGKKLFTRSVNTITIWETAHFNENLINDGTIESGTPLEITLVDDTFSDLGTGLMTATQLVVGNVPAGLTAVVTITSPTTAEVSLTGVATDHEAVNSVDNLTFAFTDLAFTSTPASGVTNSGDGTPFDSNIGVTFRDEIDLSVTKTAVFNDTNSNTFADVGETITYTFTMTNNSAFGMFGISITDPNATIYTGDAHVLSITEDISNAGVVIIYSVANSYVPQIGDDVNGTWTDTFSTPFVGTITSVVDNGGGNYSVEGLGPAPAGGPHIGYGAVVDATTVPTPVNLGPGFSDSSYTAIHTITPADIAAGQVVNQGQANIFFPEGIIMTDDPSTPTIDDATITVLSLSDPTPPPTPSTTPDLVSGSDLGDSPTDDLTSDTTPTFDVECTEAGATVTLYSDNPSADTAVGTHLCVGVATEQATVTPGLADGSHNIKYTVKDPAGNETPATSELTIVIDATPPSAPTIDTPTAGPNSDNTPTVEGSGGTPGDTVTVTGPLGETCTTTVDGSGDWSCDISPSLAEGGPQTISVVTEDPAGNTSPPSTVIITVDTIPPASAPTVIAPSDGDELSDDTPTVNGSGGTPGDIMVVTAPGGETCSATVDGAGLWSCDLPSLPEGSQTITIVPNDPAGNEGPSTPVDVVIDTLAPTTPVAAPDMTAGTDTGPSNTDNVTFNTSPSFTVECPFVGAQIHIVSSLPTPGTGYGTHTCTGSGSEDATLPSGLPEGTHDISYRVEDLAGNLSGFSPELGITVDNTPNGAPSVTAPSGGDIVSGTPEFSGSGGTPGETVVVDGPGSSDCTAIIDASGDWACTLSSALSEGPGQIVIVSITDLAGNPGVPVPISIDVDTVSPPAPTAAPDLISASDGGPSDTDNITSDDTPTIDVVCTEADSTIELYSDNPTAGTIVGTHVCVSAGTVPLTIALPEGEHSITYKEIDEGGNESPESPVLELAIDTTAPTIPTGLNIDDGDILTSTTPTITGGSATPGDIVTVNAPGGQSCTATVDASGNWSCVISPALVDGSSITLTIGITDLAGNVGPTTGRDIDIDATAPPIPSVAPDLTAGSDTGPSDSDDATNDDTPTIDVVCTEADSTIELYSDNPTAGTIVGTHVCVSAGTVPLTIALPEGEHSITYKEIDEGGNESPESPVLELDIDTTVNPGVINGPTNGGPVTGTSEPGSIVVVTTPTTTCTATANASGLWSCDLSPTPQTGEAITIIVTDPAGNNSTPTITGVGEGIDLGVATDTDGDGVSDTDEDTVSPNGDANGDGTPDSQQSNVTTVSNPVTGAHTALEVTNGCLIINGFGVVAESSLSVQDDTHDYPVGLNDFTLTCANPGDSADVTFYYDQAYDTSAWSFKKYDTSGTEYSDITDLVVFGTATVNGSAVTTATYTVTDGGLADVDGTVNGTIVDPAGPAIVLGTDDDKLSETGQAILLVMGMGALIGGAAVAAGRKSKTTQS